MSSTYTSIWLSCFGLNLDKQFVMFCENTVGEIDSPCGSLVNVNFSPLYVNPISFSTGMLKNALARSMTEKYFPSLRMEFRSVCGFGTFGALWTMASFMALRSWIILHASDGGAFFTGKIGVLHVASGHATITPAFFRASITGAMPSSASGFSGYCLILGLYSDFPVIVTGSAPVMSPTSAGPLLQTLSGIKARASSSSGVSTHACMTSISHSKQSAVWSVRCTAGVAVVL